MNTWHTLGHLFKYLSAAELGKVAQVNYSTEVCNVELFLYTFSPHRKEGKREGKQ